MLLPTENEWEQREGSKKAKDEAGRGTGKARNPGALSTVGPVKNQEEEGGLPSMM